MSRDKVALMPDGRPVVCKLADAPQCVRAWATRCYQNGALDGYGKPLWRILEEGTYNRDHRTVALEGGLFCLAHLPVPCADAACRCK